MDERVSIGRKQYGYLEQPHIDYFSLLRNFSWGHRSFLLPSCRRALGLLCLDSSLSLAPFFPDEENSVAADK